MKNSRSKKSVKTASQQSSAQQRGSKAASAKLLKASQVKDKKITRQLAVKSTKGAQMREKIKQATLQVLEHQGYHQMRVADVTSQANIAVGLFYHYFKDLHSLTREVLGDFIAASQNLERIEKHVVKGDWYERIYAHNYLVVSSYAKHPGVMRCLFQMADEDPLFAADLHQQFVAQLNWLVVLMPKIFPQTTFLKNQALQIVYTLAGLGERILRDYYINLNIKQTSPLIKNKINIQQMSELISVIFYRGLFLENPPVKKLNYMKNIYTVKKRVSQKISKLSSVITI